MHSEPSQISARRVHTGRLRVIALVAYIVGAAGLFLEAYVTASGPPHATRNLQMASFSVATVIAVLFVLGTLKSKWFALGSCLMAIVLFLGVIPQPLTAIVDRFTEAYGKVLAMICSSVAFVASVLVLFGKAQPNAQADREDAAA